MGWLRKALGRLAGPVPAAEPAAPAAPAAAPPDWKSLGNAALAAGNLAQARRCYEQGVEADPGQAALRVNLGYVLLEQGHWRGAADQLEQALALGAGDGAHEAHYLLGRARVGAGQAHRALASFEAAALAQPGFAEPLEEGVRLLHQAQRHAEAADWAKRLFDVRPSVFARLLAANELSLSGRDDEAAEFASAAVAQEPGNLDASALLFNSLFRLGRFPDALAEAQRALALTGPDPGALVNVAAALEKLGRLEEALAHLDRALQLDPSRRDALVNRTGVLTDLLRIPEAVDAARAALRQHPEDADLHWHLAIAHLLLGEFEPGWQESEWRTKSAAYRGPQMDLDAPRWQGESLQGRAIFLYGEQGFGDNIQFVRYLPRIAALAATVYLQVPTALEPLMQGLPPNCRLLSEGDRLPAFDFHCSLMSLPTLLGTRIDSIPAAVPYLRADSGRTRQWRERLPRDTFNVGIAWSGKTTHVNDHNRSMTLDTFRAIEVPGCRFVTVQPQLRDVDAATLAAWPQALDFGSELRDFADTAALVEALDLVISVDTGVAHLAGALARPLWILLPHAPDWRWMLEREDTPWYPTARLYRQSSARDWAGVLARVRNDLAAAVRGPASA
jgi:tetratricopeptide (TPR) repeat protein